MIYAAAYGGTGVSLPFLSFWSATALAYLASSVLAGLGLVGAFRLRRALA